MSLMRFYSGTTLLVTLMIFPACVYSQSRVGIPYNSYFSPKEYQADPQNWAAIQRLDGTIVVGNGRGVMTFDGRAWNTLPLPNNNLVRALAQGNDELLFIGGYNELGFMDYTIPAPKYISLVSKLPQDKRDFGHIWSIVCLRTDTYFSTDKNLLLLRNESLRSIKLPGAEGKPFITNVGDKLCVQPSGDGLYWLQQEKLMPFNGGSFFNKKRVVSIIPLGDGNSIICTLTDGLYFYDGKSSRPFASDLNSFFVTNRVYKGISLKDGGFAIGTLQAGVMLLNSNGTMRQSLKKGSGLGDNAVYNLLEDRQGGLWVTMSVGITRVEANTFVSRFDERNGLNGAVNDVIEFENEYYASTMLGLFKLKAGNSADAQARFEQMKVVNSSVWASVISHNSLLLASDEGTIELKNGKHSLLDQESGAVMLASQNDPDIVFVGLTDGLVVLRFSEGKWRSVGRVKGVEADIGEMNEDRDGNIWLGTFSEGVIRLQFAGTNPEHYLSPRVTSFDATDGLPVGYTQLNRIGDLLVFRIEPDQTLYTFDDSREKFTRIENEQIQKSALDSYDSTRNILMSGEKDGKLWMADRLNDRSYNLIRLEHLPSGYQKTVLPFARVRDDFDETIFEDQNGVLWMGGLDGIIRYDMRNTSKITQQFVVKFNTIALNTDSVIHQGIQNATQGLSYPFQLNSITFSYGATFFDLPDDTEYQYILDGFDDDWSAWSTQPSKSYTQIDEGEYRFNVRARNIYGTVGPASTFSFVIHPPWYRHVIAYGVYILISGGFIYALVVARSRKLERDKIRLVQIINERTNEISVQNKQLEQQAEALKNQTERLKEVDQMKSAFFTNISHEFRTPLSLILAPLERDISAGNGSQEMQMMYRNAGRLQFLINQLLDLSRLESGQMKVYPERNDLAAFVSLVLESFQSLAENRNILFNTLVPAGALYAMFDSEKLETILYNLLSNAFKFTPEGHSVSFAMEVDQQVNHFRFLVSDTGPGITDKDLPRIFDRFYQVETDSRRSFEGSGIGLALTKELVSLMSGTISVESRIDVGTTFKVELPFVTCEPIDMNVSRIVLKDPATAPMSVDAESIGLTQGEKTVLLVEDNNDLRTYLKGILEKFYQVLVAEDGEAGWQLARTEIPDLVVSDMMMPRMDGFTLCEEIRKEATTSHIPFILLTARSTVESRLAGLELGADDYMTKPFITAELLVRVRNLLQQRALLQARFREELVIAPKNITVTSADENFIRQLMAVVERNLSDTTFSVERLSEEMSISRKHLHRKLVALAGQTPNEFIRVFRLKLAMQMLLQQSGSVKEIAIATGFNNLSYFSKCFRDEFGVPPNDVRQRNGPVSGDF